MSIQSVQDYDYNDYKPRKTVVINQSLATSSLFSFNFNNHLRFQPKFMIIRSILYMPTALGNDIGTWLIWCSIVSANIGAFNVGVQANSHFPETVIPITTAIQSVDFNITSATGNSATVPGGIITMTVEFY
jgi:hypothetical protein